MEDKQKSIFASIIDLINELVGLEKESIQIKIISCPKNTNGNQKIFIWLTINKNTFHGVGEDINFSFACIIAYINAVNEYLIK